MSPDGERPSPTPEDRLLEVIRQQEQAPAAGASRASLPAGQTPPGVLSGIADKRERARRWPSVVIPMLIAAIVFEIIGMVVLAARDLPAVDTSVPPAPEGQAAAPAPEETVSLAKDIRRVLFVPPPRPQIAREDEGKTAAIIAELNERLSLKGVIDGDPPQAIIEDKVAGKTLFARPGQTLIEGAVVESITSSAVVLRVDKEQLTLTL